MRKKNYLTANAKTSIVLELLRGEDIETLSRKHQVTVGQISQWRNDFINGGKQGFKKDPEAAKLKQAERLIGKMLPIFRMIRLFFKLKIIPSCYLGAFSYIMYLQNSLSFEWKERMENSVNSACQIIISNWCFGK